MIVIRLRSRGHIDSSVFHHAEVCYHESNRPWRHALYDALALRQGWLAWQDNRKAKQMLVFIDTEFTNHAQPDLISIGLAAVGGNDFYVERTDYRREHCTAFVLAEIVPLLGRVPGAACTAPELARRLRAWFGSLPEPATILYDFETDWQLLQAAFVGALPDNIDGHQLVDHKMFRHSAYKLGEVMVYSAARPPHHALADAQALREGYLRWMAATNGLEWRSRG